MKFLVHKDNNQTKVAINNNGNIINIDNLIKNPKINDINYVIANIEKIEKK